MPSNHKPSTASVTLTLTDASGQEVFHSYTLQVINDNYVEPAPDKI